MSPCRLALRAASAAALLASIALVPVARAGDTSLDKEHIPGSVTAYMKMKPDAIWRMMDMDKKGYIMKEDFMMFHEMMFDKMDKNKDGKLTREEWSGAGG